MKNSFLIVTLIALAGSLVVAQAEPFDLMASVRGIGAQPKPARLKIPPGTYRLPQEGLKFSRLEDVRIEAEGVTLLASSFHQSVLTFEGCKNIELSGVTIDYEPLPFTQGTVVSVDPKTMRALFEIHKGYPALTDEYLVARFHLFEKGTQRWKKGAPDFYLKPVPLSSHSGYIDFGSHPDLLKWVEPGDKVAFNIREASAVAIKDGCEGLVFRDVTLHASSGLGVMVRFAKDAGRFERLRLAPGPRPAGASEDRLMSTCADGMNVAYTRKGPVLKSCDFSYMGDDALNVHGVVFPVLKWEDERTFLTMRPQRGEPFEKVVEKEDEVRLIKPPFYEVTDTRRIEEFTKVTQDAETWIAVAKKIWPTFAVKACSFFRVRLDRAPETRDGELFCEIPNTAAPGYAVEDSYFHDHRARGLRLMGNDGVVRNNRFERIKGVAISIGPEIGFWREAGWCRNVAVRSNGFTDIAEGANVLSPDSVTLGAVSVMCHLEKPDARARYYQGNENIRIEANRFERCAVDAVSVVAARNVLVSDNIIRQVNLEDAGQSGSGNGLSIGNGISVIQSDAEVRNNNTK